MAEMKMKPKMKTKRARRASGGKTPGGHLYNAEGSPAAKSAMDDKDDGFKRGGAMKKHERKHGGHVEGEKEKERLDKRARGGHIKKRAMGGSPMSSGHTLSDMSSKGSGHEGEAAPECD